MSSQPITGRVVYNDRLYSRFYTKNHIIVDHVIPNSYTVSACVTRSLRMGNQKIPTLLSFGVYESIIGYDALNDVFYTESGAKYKFMDSPESYGAKAFRYIEGPRYRLVDSTIIDTNAKSGIWERVYEDLDWSSS